MPGSLTASLSALAFFGPEAELPPRAWLESLLGKTVDAFSRRACCPANRPIPMPMSAASSAPASGWARKPSAAGSPPQKLESVAAIGQCLKAGTNCGSCQPELKKLQSCQPVDRLTPDRAEHGAALPVRHPTAAPARVLRGGDSNNAVCRFQPDIMKLATAFECADSRHPFKSQQVCSSRRHDDAYSHDWSRHGRPQRFLETLAARAGDMVHVTVIAEEARPAYDRVQLVRLLQRQDRRRPQRHPARFLRRHRLPAEAEHPRHRHRPGAKTVTPPAGDVVPFDKLVLATGSYPFVPPVPGNDREGCLVYRTIEDLEAIRDAAAKSKVGVVVGGGLLGLEAAKALKDLGLQTHVVEFAPRLMAVQIDDGGGRLLRRKIEALGVGVHTERNTKEIVDGETCRHAMKFADGKVLETDMILFSAGIRPRDELAKSSGLTVGPRGGIAIDNVLPHQPRRRLRHWRMRAVGQQDLRAGRPRLQHGRCRLQPPAERPSQGIPRCRHEHQAQADGRGRGSIGDATEPHPAA
jgi:hypothetical protein